MCGRAMCGRASAAGGARVKADTRGGAREPGSVHACVRCVIFSLLPVRDFLLERPFPVPLALFVALVVLTHVVLNVAELWVRTLAEAERTCVTSSRADDCNGRCFRLLQGTILSSKHLESRTFKRCRPGWRRLVQWVGVASCGAAQ